MSDLSPDAQSEMALIAARERITELERGLVELVRLRDEKATREADSGFKGANRAYREEKDAAWSVARSLLASMESSTPQEAHEIEVETRNDNNGMTFGARCSCGWESAETEENSFLAIERHGEPHLASVGQPREDDEPKVPCVVCGATEELPSGDCKYCTDRASEKIAERMDYSPLAAALPIEGDER